MMTRLLYVLGITGFLFSCQSTDKQDKITENTQRESEHLVDNPNQPRRPENFTPFNYKYSTVELYEKFSDDMMKRAEKDRNLMSEVIQNGKFKADLSSLTKHEIPEWFHDAKLGIFLDWGPWSVPGYAPLKGAEASTGGSYPDWYEFLMDNLYKEYHDEVWGADFRRDDFLPLLTGENFDAEDYMSLAEQAGAKYFVPFTRHHAGWAMWDSEYTFRNAVEMGPGRDIYKELVDAARKRDIKTGFYFSVSEWEYPVIVENNLSQWDPYDNLAIFQDALGQIPRATPLRSYFPAEMDGKISGKIPVKDYFADYMMPLFKEGVDKYDPDLVWYDGGWGSPVSVSRTMETTAYFYNQAEGKKPVVVNNRAGSTLSTEDLQKVRTLMESGRREEAMAIYLNGQQLGDYGTPEYTIGEVDINKKWEVCRSISSAFGYNWQDDDESSLSSEELIEMFIGIVAKNGNLLLVVSPDGSGYLPEIQRSRLVELGEWMSINAESIHNTRPFEIQEADNMFFTTSKDKKHLYIHALEWPGENLVIESEVLPEDISEVRLLGHDNPLVYSKSTNRLTVQIPQEIQNENNRPGKYAWVFKASIN